VSRVDELRSRGRNLAAAATRVSEDKYPGYEQTAGRVLASMEYDRVTALPREHWHEDEDLADLVAELTAWLRQPGGSMTLWPVQAAALQTIYDNDGMVGAIGVGKGKTLITYLAGTVLGVGKVLVLVPAALRDKTRRDFEALSEHWICNCTIEVESYERIGRVNGPDTLLDMHPDMIIADEAHALRNLKAAVTRHVGRYLLWRRADPDVEMCRFVAVSGTLTSRSLNDYAHLLKWALGMDAAPVPRSVDETNTWSRAVDEKLDSRAHPGALRFWLDEDTEVTLSTIRQAMRERIFSAPGVLHTTENDVDASIQISTWDPKLHPDLDALLDQLIQNKKLPNGDEVSQPSEIWRHVRELVCGFYYLWDPEPPAEWMEARRAWRAFVAERIDENREGLDSELQIANACTAGTLDASKYDAWTEVRDRYRINAVPVWVTDSTLRQVAEQIKEPTLIWVEHRAVGERLSEIMGLPYFRRKGKDSNGLSIEDYDPSLSAILSIASNKQGRNLQAWHRNFVVTPPPNGAILEQLIARTHREGQTADTVFVRFAMGHYQLYRALDQAFADARYIEDAQGQKQKLLIADRASSTPTTRASKRASKRKGTRK